MLAIALVAISELEMLFPVYGVRSRTVFVLYANRGRLQPWNIYAEIVTVPQIESPATVTRLICMQRLHLIITTSATIDATVNAIRTM